MSLENLQDKVVVITGAGSGMGRELARQAAQQGALLAISDWNADGLAETVDLVKALGAEVRSDVVDVSDRAAVAQWAVDVVGQFGRVNLVVNNAGVSVTGDFEEMSYEDFDWIVGVNLNGVVNGTKEFLPHLIASGNGALVNISSLFGLVSMPGQTAYNATKYAVRGFTEALREEMLVNRHPVTVTCVHPGGIKTGIVRHGRTTASQDHAKLAAMFDTKLAKMPADKAASDHPQGRALRKGSRARRRSTRTSCTTSPSSPARATRTSSPASRRASRRVDSVAAMAHAPGDPIRVEVTKWGDRPHWQFDGTLAGQRRARRLAGLPGGHPQRQAGLRLRLPGRPRSPSSRAGGHWIATFHAPGIWCDLYIDVCTPATWDGVRPAHDRPGPRRDPDVDDTGRVATAWPAGRSRGGAHRRRGRVPRAPGRLRLSAGRGRRGSRQRRRGRGRGVGRRCAVRRDEPPALAGGPAQVIRSARVSRASTRGTARRAVDRRGDLRAGASPASAAGRRTPPGSRRTPARPRPRRPSSWRRCPARSPTRRPRAARARDRSRAREAAARSTTPPRPAVAPGTGRRRRTPRGRS